MQFEQTVAGDAPQPGASPLLERPAYQPLAAFRLFGAPIFMQWQALILYGAWALLFAGIWVEAQDWTMERRLLIGALVVVVLPVSILAHELAHWFAARACGVGVRYIELTGSGGLTRLVDVIATAPAQFAVSFAGPLTNAVIAWTVGALLLGLDPGQADGDLRTAIIVVALLNAGLALENVLPAAGRDGGEALRAFLMFTLGLEAPAAATAVKYISRFAVAAPLILVGIVLLPVATVAGVWIAYNGFGIWQSASHGVDVSKALKELEELTVGLCLRPMPSVAPEATFHQVMETIWAEWPELPPPPDWFVGAGVRVERDGRLLGVLDHEALNEMELEPELPAGEFMVPAPLLPLMPVDTTVTVAATAVTERKVHHALVDIPGEAVAVLSMWHIERERDKRRWG